MPTLERMSRGELRAVVGGIITDVMDNTDLDFATKKIIATALENLGRLCEFERRRLSLH
jgi:hypothetical protein